MFCPKQIHLEISVFGAAFCCLSAPTLSLMQKRDRKERLIPLCPGRLEALTQ